MSHPVSHSASHSDSSLVIAQIEGRVGFITLNRPRALNALSLAMIRSITAALLAWRDDAAVEAVAIRGMGKDAGSPGGSSPFGAFCAGGDIQFFHQTALQGGVAMEDFFTEEYALNHLIHTYPKPYIAFLDGIVFGGGMGISQGAVLRIVTERTRMGMPETNIGLFPDVGGGYFLGRCPGRLGEFLALTGQVMNADDALAAGLADIRLASGQLPACWRDLAAVGPAVLADWQPTASPAGGAGAAASAVGGSALAASRQQIDHFFALPTVLAIVEALERDASPWAAQVAAVLRQRSPLMLAVALEQVRRGRDLSLADDLRMERGMMRHCFHLRPGAASETVEGIRALVIDKDQRPRWNPPRIEDVTTEMVAAFFESPWPVHAHPLKHLN